MDFKIEISCAKCKCLFELRPQDFKNRPAMECPNCGQAFPSAVYEKIKTGVEALGAVPEYVNEDSENPYSENLFAVRVKSFGTMHDLYDRSKN